MARSPARAEVVGSLLRPAKLEGGEDEAIARVVQQQIDIGMDVVTDGELRRSMFLDSFWGAVEGWSRNDSPIEFRDDRGNTITWNVQRIEDRLKKVASPASREVEYLKSITEYPFKVTFPAASLFALPFTFKPGVNDHAYRDLDELVSHVVEIEKDLVKEAIASGARRYVREDGPRIVMGIVSSKRPELEREDDLMSRMEEAAEHVPWERLAISTQCGFASTAVGNDLTEDDQWRKLELVSKVAYRIWG